MSASPAPVLPENLLPPPRRCTLRPGTYALSPDTAIALPAGASARLLRSVRGLADALEARAGFRPGLTVAGSTGVRPGDIALSFAEAGEAESYRLEITAESVSVSGGSEVGLHYGLQTLRQIIDQRGAELPALSIDDAPCFPERGYYYDVTRGKVPTRAFLEGLIAQASHLKLNQVQLYVEHTFAFRGHPDIWQGADPLTAEDILALDACAREHFVELIPSLASFGHLATLLRSPRKAGLGELTADLSRRPFSWWDRMQRGTLNPRDPRSLALIRELFGEFLPLFSSRRFNLCGDETFDLGRGRNAAEAASSGTGRLYVDFVQALCAVAHEHGRQPMLWADIIGHHPDLLRELPADLILLDWDYDPDLRTQRLALLQPSGRTFYVCPGVQGWRGWIAPPENAWTNITEFARRGLAAGARGLLNTDWGDFGHVNFWAHSLYGFVLGACAAWNTEGVLAAGPAAYGQAWSRRFLGDASGRAAACLEEAGRSHPSDWWNMVFLHDPSPDLPADWFREVHGERIPNSLLKQPEPALEAQGRRLRAIAAELRSLALNSPLGHLQDWRELAAGCETAACLQEVHACVQHAAGLLPGPGPDPAAVADRIRRIEPALQTLWLARNRPSEYYRARLVLLEIAAKMDRLALARTAPANPATPSPT